MCKKSINLRDFEIYKSIDSKKKRKVQKHEKNLNSANYIEVSEIPVCIARIKTVLGWYYICYTTNVISA